MAGTGRVYVTAVRNVGTIQSTHQYDVDVRFDIAFDWGGYNNAPCSYTISCDGQNQSGQTSFSVPSGGGKWVWTNIGNTKTFRITMPNSGQGKTIGFSASINTGINPPNISASGSHGLAAVTWQWTISYNANGGSGAPPNQTKIYGSNLTLSSTKPTRTGYTFKGWATSPTGGVSYTPGSTFGVDATTTLYAVWEINKYTVGYNANGGSGAPASQMKTYGVNLILSSTKPIRTNYNFLGWATSQNANAPQYAPGATYINNESVTLYAVWKLSYWEPKVTGLTINRCDSKGNIDDFGTCAKVVFNWELCQIVGSNSIKSIVVKYKITTSSSWSSTSISATGTSGKVSSVIAVGALSIDNQYDFQVIVTDSKGGVTTPEGSIGGSAFALDLKAGGKGVSIGKPSTKEGFDVGMRSYFDSRIDIKDFIYDKFGYRINNGLAGYYTGGTQIDPNTTLDELVLTDKNTPTGAYAYIMTMFYNSKSTSSNRAQISIPYHVNNSMFYRFYYRGSWSAWRKIMNADEVDTWKTSGIWTYIKRADGTAECFTTTMYTLDNVDVNQGAWNGYVSNYIQLPSFPFSFTSIPHVTINTVVMDPGFHGDYMMIYNVIQNTEENTLKTYPPKFKYWRGSAITFGHPRVTCHAIGRWK